MRRAANVVIGPALLLATALVACASDNAERCGDLDAILQARGNQLPTACASDGDCRVIEVRPGIPAATSGEFDAATVDHLLAAYEQDCGEFEQQSDSAVARCVTDDDGRRACQLEIERGQGVEPRRDAGQPDGDRDALDTRPDRPDAGPDPPDAPICSCLTDPDCPAEASFCAGCVCRDLCGLACFRADECNRLQELNLGADVTDCTLRCQNLLAGDPSSTLAVCLGTSACELMEDCL